MVKPRDFKKKVTLLVGDLIVMIFSTYLSVLLRSFTYVDVLNVYTGATTFSIVTYLLSFYIFDLYNLDYRFKNTSYLTSFLLAVFTATSLIAITFYILPSWKFGRGTFLINAASISVFVYLWRLSFQFIFASPKKPKVIAIVGAGHTGKTIYDVLHRNKAFRIKGLLDNNPEKLDKQIGDHSVIGNCSILKDLVKRREIDSVVIAIKDEKNEELLNALVETKMSGVEIYNMASLYEELTGKLPVMHLSNGWMAYTTFQGVKSSIYNLQVKRLIDVGLSVAGLIISLPITIVTALAIKRDSKGPVFFSQQRVGFNEKKYKLLKFRSMSVDAEANGAIWAERDDPRVTRIGRIIRKIRIDEIPQMWNVLKGEMSFIGPRPERPEFVEHLKHEIPFYSFRHAVKPGITGWAQVNYQYGASKNDAIEKLQYDLFYIKNLSSFLELHIILRTIRVVLFGKGAR